MASSLNQSEEEENQDKMIVYEVCASYNVQDNPEPVRTHVQLLMKPETIQGMKLQVAREYSGSGGGSGSSAPASGSDWLWACLVACGCFGEDKAAADDADQYLRLHVEFEVVTKQQQIEVLHHRMNRVIDMTVHRGINCAAFVRRANLVLHALLCKHYDSRPRDLPGLNSVLLFNNAPVYSTGGDDELLTEACVGIDDEDVVVLVQWMGGDEDEVGENTEVTAANLQSYLDNRGAVNNTPFPVPPSP